MGYLKIISAILIWSSLGIFIRKVGIPTIRVIFYPSLIAGILQLIIILISGEFKKPLIIKDKRALVILAVMPLLSLANTFLFFFAYKHTTIANAVFTHYTAPIFVALMAPVFLKEVTHRKIWIAIILSSIGLWLTLGTITSGWGMLLKNGELTGIMAGLLSGVAYAILILVIRRVSQEFSPLLIIFMQNAVISIILLPFIINTPHPVSIMPYMVIMGVVHSTLAPILYIDGLKTVRANDAAVLGYIEPIGAIILATIFLHEFPDIKALIGGCLILYSGWMVISGKYGKIEPLKR
ncbi:MAG: EamA family transporter [Thermodesulfovibrionia bacterium]